MSDPHDIDWRAQRALFGWLWRGFMRPYWPGILLAGLLMSIEGSMLGLLSYMMKPMFDTVFIGGNTQALYWVGTVIFLTFMVRAVTNMAQRVLITRISSKVIFEIQTALLKHLMTLDTLFHSRNPPGYLMDRVVGDTSAIRNVANVLITGMGRDVVALLSLMAVVLWIDWRWTMIALLGAPLLVLPTILVQRYVRRTTRENREIAGQMSVRLDEVFHGINAVKLNTLEAYQARRFRGLADARIRTEVRAGLGKSMIPAMIDIMSGIGFFAVLLFAGREIIAGEKSVGEFMSFFTAMALAFDPLRRLGAISGIWQVTAVSLDRLKTMFDTTATLKSPAHPKPLPAAMGDITFENVSLAYGDLPVLRNITFTAKAGQTTALVGASGAGKSTVFNALTRLVETTEGRVALGGADIRELDLADLRAQFSMVSQDALLFDETLRDNILLGREDVSEAQLRQAMDAAHITDFVGDLPDGLESPAGPRGSSLSGGQRQRVAIARALLRDTPILLLDEATSALDAQSEALVQNALDKLSQTRTTLVIAHRLSTVRNAHKILVMAEGRVIEEGTHGALLARQGAYAELYQLQFKGEGVG